MIRSFVDRYDLALTLGTTQARTGYGFTPKLLIGLGLNRSSGSSALGGRTALMNIGVCTGVTTARNVAMKWDDDSGGGSVLNASSASITRFLGTYNDALDSTTSDAEWEVSAIGGDGITTRVSVAETFLTFSPSVTLLALGGPAIANAELGSFTLQDPPATTVVSSHSFAPDAVLFFASSAFPGISIGAASKRGAGASATTSCSRDSATVNPSCHAYGRVGECIQVLDRSNTQRGQLTKWRGDGFEVTSLDNPLGTFNRTVHYVAIRMAPGFACQVVSGTTSASTGITAAALEPGFTPSAGLIVSHGRAQSTAGVADADGVLSMGVFGGASPTQGAIGAYCTTSTAATVATAISTSSIYSHMTSGDALAGEMAISALQRGNINFNMVDGDPSPALWWGLLFGSVPRPGGSPIFF